MRTSKEIRARLDARKKNDMFGFETGEYVPYLEFEDVKDLLKEGVTVEDWNKDRPKNTREEILAKMLDYMPFAWEKANNCRGLSAGRSVMHYEAWIWLVGDMDLLSFVGDSANYQHYGKEILVKICEHYGWDWKKWDNGIRTNGKDE